MCSRLSQAPKEELLDILGRPEPEELSRLDGQPLDVSLPKQLVETASWVDWADEDEEDLRIINFGEAFLQGAEARNLAQPPSLRGPETIFATGFDYKLDLWHIGIVVRQSRFYCSIGKLIFFLDRFMRP